MQIKIHARKMRFPIDLQSAAPVGDPGPPDNDSRQTERNQTNGANAVYKAAGQPERLVSVYFDEPFGDGGQVRFVHLVAEDNQAAGNAHEQNIGSGSEPYPHVEMEEGLAQPQTLWVMQPSLPDGHFPLRLRARIIIRFGPATLQGSVSRQVQPGPGVYKLIFQDPAGAIQSSRLAGQGFPTILAQTLLPRQRSNAVAASCVPCQIWQ